MKRVMNILFYSLVILKDLYNLCILLAQQEGLLCTIDVTPTMLGMGKDSSEYLTLVVDPGVAASHLAGAHEPLIMAKLFTLTAVKKWLSLLFLNFFLG